MSGVPVESEVIDLESDGKRLSAELFPGAAGRAAVVLGHGAGADRRAPLLRGLAARLGAAGWPVALYNFPYAEAGRKAPDRPPVLERAAAAAATAVARRLGAPALVLGGKSMGGRIAALLVGSGWSGPAPVRGLLFLGFPLHGAGREQEWEKRAPVLAPLQLPTLFLQGSADRLCALDRLRPLLAGRPATLHVVAGGDHSLALPRTSGRSPADVLDEVSAVALAWLETHAGGAAVV